MEDEKNTALFTSNKVVMFVPCQRLFVFGGIKWKQNGEIRRYKVECWIWVIISLMISISEGYFWTALPLFMPRSVFAFTFPISLLIGFGRHSVRFNLSDGFIWHSPYRLNLKSDWQDFSIKCCLFWLMDCLSYFFGNKVGTKMNVSSVSVWAT
jgi:hypothetical protein